MQPPPKMSKSQEILFEDWTFCRAANSFLGLKPSFWELFLCRPAIIIFDRLHLLKISQSKRVKRSCAKLDTKDIAQAFIRRLRIDLVLCPRGGTSSFS